MSVPFEKTMPTYLFIVSRQHPDLFDYLRERFAEDTNVRVIRDHRLGERRRQAAPSAAERRRAERRSRPEIDEQLLVRSHAIVTVPAEATPLHETLQWIEAIQSHLTVIRGLLTNHERLQKETDAVKQENERLRSEAERSRGEAERSRREIEEIGAELARAITIVNDLLSRMRGGSAHGHVE